ncbi:hypothetical protein ACS0TY_031116 [Phlomoides rotata]
MMLLFRQVLSRGDDMVLGRVYLATQVVGCLVEHENKILLCKRNIQPSHGLWYAFSIENLFEKQEVKTLSIPI